MSGLSSILKEIEFVKFQPSDMLRKLLQGAAFVTALFLLVGCGASKVNHEKRLILQGIDTMDISSINFPVQQIKNGDLLTILVYSDNKEVTEIYNQVQGGAAGSSTIGNASMLASSGRGYLVDEKGMIYFHSVGLIKVEGLTKNELTDLLVEKLKAYLQNPYVTVRYSTARVMVLGEVARPGMIDIPEQKVSILDAIGMAGDLTPFGRRDNVLIIREKDGVRTKARLDIRSADVYNSQFFYLQQNDLVYIEPNRRKPTGNEQVLLRNITVATSIISILTIVTTLILR